MPLLLHSHSPSPMAVVSIRRPPLLHVTPFRSLSRFSVPLHTQFSCSLAVRNRFGNGIGSANSVGKGEAEVSVEEQGEEEIQEEEEQEEEKEEEEEEESESTGEEMEVTQEDLDNITEIKRVLKILKEKRDMTFGEVKLTIMIEDPRDIERKRLLGIEDPEEITRDDLADALVDVNEGRIPENRVTLALLAKEMTEWPDLDVEIEKKKKSPSKSLYARITDTGVDPEKAAKRLNLDWDSAADIQDGDQDDENEVPSAVGYGALYLVTGFPILIGVSVVLILFYNSLQ